MRLVAAVLEAAGEESADGSDVEVEVDIDLHWQSGLRRVDGSGCVFKCQASYTEAEKDDGCYVRQSVHSLRFAGTGPSVWLCC